MYLMNRSAITAPRVPAEVQAERELGYVALRSLVLALILLWTVVLTAQEKTALTPPPQLQVTSPAALVSGPVLPLFDALRKVGLDPQKVYTIREAEIDREDVHLWLNDGTIAFTQAVDGHITGAYFEGDGEILVRPPDRMERASLGLFINAGVLEEKFSSAYLRFNDDTAKELQPFCGRRKTRPTSSRATIAKARDLGA